MGNLSTHCSDGVSITSEMHSFHWMLSVDKISPISQDMLLIKILGMKEGYIFNLIDDTVNTKKLFTNVVNNISDSSKSYLYIKI